MIVSIFQLDGSSIWKFSLANLCFAHVTSAGVGEAVGVAEVAVAAGEPEFVSAAASALGEVEFADGSVGSVAEFALQPASSMAVASVKPAHLVL
ncbi:hypothetical protein ACTXJX_13195 [Glutamicibacter ardleyensis]|uniref:hypothetical protein n=1 Tax=Glutamicibacter ardleyensis TaxID=225894 RepID=UPI000BB6AD78|nr:hypothetical protein CIK74_10225 [Glutamicibacter sp. BW77]